MHEWKNPFDTLGATPHDDRRRLALLAQDAALLVGEKEAQSAYTALLNPQSRLQAEVRWAGGENALSQLNRTVLAFQKQNLRTGSNAQAAELLKELCISFGSTDAETTTDLINADREKAGVLEATEAEVQQALDSYAHELAKEAVGMIASTERLGKLLLLLADLGLKMKKEQLSHSILLEELGAEYEISTADAMEKAYERIAAQVENLKTNEWARVNVEMTILCRHIDRWNVLALPLRRLNAARGLSHDPSRNCFWEVRRLLEPMFNERRLVKPSHRLVMQLRDCFSDMEELRETIADDCEIVFHSYEIAQKADERNKNALVRNIIGLAAILLVMVIFNLFTGGYEKKKPTPPNLPKTTLEQMKKHQATIEAHQQAMEHIYQKQLANLELSLLNCQKQMQETMEQHKITPTAELMEKYQELKETYQALEAEYNQKKENLDFLIRNAADIIIGLDE